MSNVIEIYFNFKLCLLVLYLYNFFDNGFILLNVCIECLVILFKIVYLYIIIKVVFFLQLFIEFLKLKFRVKVVLKIFLKFYFVRKLVNYFKILLNFV